MRSLSIWDHRIITITSIVLAQAMANIKGGRDLKEDCHCLRLEIVESYSGTGVYNNFRPRCAVVEKCHTGAKYSQYQAVRHATNSRGEKGVVTSLTLSL